MTAHQSDETQNINVCPTQSAESINDTSPKSIGSETLNSTPSGPQDFGVSTPPRIVTPRPSLDVFNTPTGGSAPYATKCLQTLETKICTEFHNVVHEVSLLTKNNVEFKEEIRKIIESSKTEFANENKQFKDEILKLMKSKSETCENEKLKQDLRKIALDNSQLRSETENFKKSSRHGDK